MQKNDLAEAIKAEEDNVTAQRGKATQGPADNGEIVVPPQPPLSNSSPPFPGAPGLISETGLVMWVFGPAAGFKK